MYLYHLTTQIDYTGSLSVSFFIFIRQINRKHRMMRIKPI
jgi:hypothetical protein